MTLNIDATKMRTPRHFGRIMAALKQARGTRDELASRAHTAGAGRTPVNTEREAVIVKYHFRPKQGERNLTQAESDQIGNCLGIHAGEQPAAETAGTL